MDQPVTLITGTRKGIGKHLAQYYVRQGHTVFGCSRSPVEWSLPGYYHSTLDVGDYASVRAMVKDVKKQCGRIDHLINNAGIASMNHVLMTPPETAKKLITTNFLGGFYFCQEVAKVMQKKKQGRIVNFSTVAVPLNLAGEALYASSKAAVVTLTQILSKELGPLGITVNAIGPTPIETDLIRAIPKEKIQALLDQQAIPRLGTYEDVHNVIDFYFSETSRFITGQTLYLGGVV